MYMVTEITSGTAEIRTQALGHPSQSLVPCAQIGERRRVVRGLQGDPCIKRRLSRVSKPGPVSKPVSKPGPGLTWILDLFWDKL